MVVVPTSTCFPQTPPATLRYTSRRSTPSFRGRVRDGATIDVAQHRGPAARLGVGAGTSDPNRRRRRRRRRTTTAAAVLSGTGDPIHPALEYEIYADYDDDDDDDDDDSSTEEAEGRHNDGGGLFSRGDDRDLVYAATRQRQKKRRRRIKLMLSSTVLIVSGVGTVVATKLQAIPLYHYPNFTNIFSLVLYIPICFAYIIPASSYSSPHPTSGPATASAPRTQNHRPRPRPPPHPPTSSFTVASLPPPPPPSSTSLVSSLSASWRCPRRSILYKFALMGCLDCLSTTLQTYAAVYVSDALIWAWLPPAAAVPVSYMVTYWSGRRQVLGLFHTIGAVTVISGLACIVMGNYWKRPVVEDEYRCEAADMERDCTVCQAERNEETCLAATAHSFEGGRAIWTDEEWTIPACRWRPYAESSVKAEEMLNLIWSVALIVSTIPMTISAMYKQKVVRRLGATSPLLYVSGWIAIFQWIASCIISIPAGLFLTSSPSIYHVLKNLYHGALCYAGHGVVKTGCHPDVQCDRAAVWLSLSVLSNVFYTLSIVMVLKYDDSSTCIVLFLSLTAVVPLSHLVLAVVHGDEGNSGNVRIATNDLAGLVLILSGLVLYRFAVPAKTMGPPMRKRRQYRHLVRQLEQAAGMETTTTIADAESSSSSGLLVPLLSAGEERPGGVLSGDV